MFGIVYSLLNRGWVLAVPALALVLLCGCSGGTTQVAATPTPNTAQATATPHVPQATATLTPTPPQATATPTPNAQTAFVPYVGKWQVHGEVLTIMANQTGLYLWNAGPCSTAMCNGNATILFTENADGSIMGTFQSVSYQQWNGASAPAGYQPSTDDPQPGDTFQLQHSGAHLLYTTWSGKQSDLNNTNRYWCDSYALKAGMKQCGA